MLGGELIVELGIEVLHLSIEIPRDALLARERLQQEVLGTKEGGASCHLIGESISDESPL